LIKNNRNAVGESIFFQAFSGRISVAQLKATAGHFHYKAIAFYFLKAAPGALSKETLSALIIKNITQEQH
jgi:hypothetical protein